MKTVSVIIACSLLSAAAGYVVGVRQSVNIRPAAATVDSDAKPAGAQTQVIQKGQALESAITDGPSETPADLAPHETTANASAHAARAEQSLQTLTDTQGRTIQAKVLKVVGDQVTIRRQDGLEATIPLSTLNSEDIEFCKFIRENSTPEPEPSNIDWDAIFG